jgi:hypothetical protein
LARITYSFAGVFLMALGLLALCLKPSHAYGQKSIFDPTTYASPSGTYSIFVNPSRPEGVGPATYRLTHAGKVVWSGEKPFTLKAACVTDDGIAAGYAEDDKTATVIIFSDTGDVRARQEIPLSYGTDDGPYPDLKGVAFDRDAGILLVTSNDQGKFRFRLSTGERLPNIPYEPAPPSDDEYRKEIARMNERERNPPSVPFRDILVRHLKVANSIDLKAPGCPPRPPIHAIRAYTIVSDNRFAIIRSMDGEAPAFLVADGSGHVLNEVKLPVRWKGEPITWQWSGCAWIGGTRYLLYTDGGYNSSPCHVWSMDTKTQSLTLVSGPDFETITTIVRLPQGGYAIHGGQRKSNGYARDLLVAFNAHGKPLWRMLRDEDDQRDDDSSRLPRLVDGLAVADERVAIADESLIRFYDARTGQYRAHLDLGSPDGNGVMCAMVLADAQGDLYACDYNGSQPSLVTVTRGRERMSPIDFRYPDGHRITRNWDQFNNTVQVSPSGRLWMSDGQALLRLDKTGRVDKALGELPGSYLLRDTSDVAVDRQGRIFALDRRDRVVHVFDAQGKWLRRCALGSQDIDFDLQMVPLFVVALSISQDEDVYLRGMNEAVRGKSITTTLPAWVHFGPDGARRGMISLEPRILNNYSSSNNYSQTKLPPLQEKKFSGASAKARPHWAVTLRGGHPEYVPSTEVSGAIGLVTPAYEVVREIKRRPDGTWFHRITDVETGPDGSAAVLDMDDEENAFVSLYSAQGKPLSGFKVPDRLNETSSVAYSGSLILLGERGGIVAMSPLGVPQWQLSTGSKTNFVFATDRSDTFSVWSPSNRVLRYFTGTGN